MKVVGKLIGQVVEFLECPRLVSVDIDERWFTRISFDDIQKDLVQPSTLIHSPPNVPLHL
jgi:hypothetical protein